MVSSAIVAVTDSSAGSSAGVVWHQLTTRDPDTAAMMYSALFDWSFTEDVDLGQLRHHQRFAFDAGESSSGLISDVEGRPRSPYHWLFFSVPSIDVAVDRVRRHGGIVIGPIELPNGVRVAAWDDAQGATFGLVEPEDAARLASVAARLRWGSAAETAEAEPELW
ncbi:hypothetical protein BE17_35525 [Sorangium cellulosum]|uniref:VOC domain-containing protein n=1 Tax=Sorangium cellulosum TaxID=56 RepID=A0A150S7Z1_SORCE|nr:hypothetical protein BE17_35525 [Sorangium cellulosum]